LIQFNWLLLASFNKWVIMNRNRIFVCLFGLLATVSSASMTRAETSPTWTDLSGKFKIVAEFVQVDGDIVVLRKDDGTEVRVPMTKLSSPSRVQARKAAKAMGASGVSSGASTEASDMAATSSSPAVPFPDGMTCQQTVQFLIDESAKGNHRVLFDSLPTKHRGDLTEIMQLAGKQLDPKLFAAIESSSDRVIKLLRSKKQLILGSQILAQFNTSQYIGVYDAGVNMLEAAVATEIINPKRLQSSDPGVLIGVYLKKLTPAIEKLMQAITEAGIEIPQQAGMTNLKDNKFTVEEKSSTEAVVTIDNAGKKQPSDWVLIDGRWVQNDIVKEWDSTMQKARDGLNALTEENQSKVIQQMKTIDSQFIAKLEAVKTQQDLDMMIVPMLIMAGPMMQQMGGGGIPGAMPNAGPVGGIAPPAFGQDPNSTNEP